MSEPAGVLDHLVGDAGRFAKEHWGIRPLHRPGAADVAGLLDLGDVDHLVTETLLRTPGMRLVRDGTPVPAAAYTRTIRVGSRRVDGVARPEAVLREFAAGATIVLQALHRQWGPVARLCRDLEMDLTHPVQANAYITPATSQGFAVHHDTHDVFVIQTNGTKRWRVYAPLVELAGKEQRWSRDLGDPGDPILEADLRPGDLLYVPRGFPHDAVAQQDVSVHVTVGILTRTWLDVWRQVMESAPDHAPFREALPVGFARDPAALSAEIAVRVDEFREWIDSSADVARDVVRRFWEGRRPVLEGQLLQVAAVNETHAGSRFRRRPGLFEVLVEGDEAVAFLGNRELRMPAFAAAALERVASAWQPVLPSDLPGLNEASALVLLRRLVREGAAEIVTL